MASFYTILTSVGQAKVANAVAIGQKVNLSTLAVGDANGVTPQPDANAKALVHERRRAPLNRVEVDKDNPNFIVCEQVLPPDVGGWEIREIGVFDDEGNLIAYGNYPPTYKPLLNEGTSRTQTVRMVMQVSDTAAVTLKVDPSIVLATREYVDESLSAIAKSGQLNDGKGVLDRQHGGTGRNDGVIEAKNIIVEKSGAIKSAEGQLSLSGEDGINFGNITAKGHVVSTSDDTLIIQQKDGTTLVINKEQCHLERSDGTKIFSIQPDGSLEYTGHTLLSRTEEIQLKQQNGSYLFVREDSWGFVRGNDGAITWQIDNNGDLVRGNVVTDIRLSIIGNSVMYPGAIYGNNNGELIARLKINGAVDASGDEIMTVVIQLKKNGVWYTANRGVY